MDLKMRPARFLQLIRKHDESADVNSPSSDIVIGNDFLLDDFSSTPHHFQRRNNITNCTNKLGNSSPSLIELPSSANNRFPRSASVPCSSLLFFCHGADFFAAKRSKKKKIAMVINSKSKRQQQQQQNNALADSPTPSVNASSCSGRASSSKMQKNKGKPLREACNGTGAGSLNCNEDAELVLPSVCPLLPQSSPIPAISNGLTSGEEIVSGKTRVELVRLTESGRSDLGLILAGGADKEDRLHVISIQPGSTAHRTDRILIGDYITAINGVSTLRLKQTEIMTLIGNSRHSLVFELHYRLCPTALTRPASPPRMHRGSPQVVDIGLRGSPIETKRTEIVIPRDPTSGPTVGLVLRGGARLDRDRTCPVFVVQIRPGSVVHRDGGIRPGDRLLAINGTDLTGLHLDDIYGLLADFHAQQSTMTSGPNHQPLPLRLLVEYDVLKSSVETAGRTTTDEWVMEFCRQSGSDIGLSLSATYIDGRSCMVVDNVRQASFADRTGIIKAGDILLSINGQDVEGKMPSDVMTLLKYGSLSSSTTSPKLGSTLRLQFLRPAQTFGPVGSLSSVSLRQETSPPTYSSRTVPLSQSYHATLSTSNGPAVAKRSATLTKVSAADIAPTMITASNVVSTPTLMPRGRGETPGIMTNSLMIPSTAVNNASAGFYPLQPALGVASATNSMNRLKRRGSIGSVTSFSSTCSANGGYVFHSETMDVYIESTTVATDCQPGCGGLGANFGISVQKSPVPPTNATGTGTIGRSTLYNATTAKNCLTIGAIEYNSPADRIGLLQEGDRVLQINGHSLVNKPPEIAGQLLHDSGPVCQLRVEFDVADSFAISNGVFHVRLPNRGPSLGLAAVALPSATVTLINGNGQSTQQSRVFITDIRRGSVAYRCGNLMVGDEIISVNSCQLESVIDLISNVQHAGDIAVLKIRRSPAHNHFYAVTYGVHFEIGEMPLGIGLARTDNPFYPFVVTLLDESGLAFRSNAVHLGDYLVAVNDLDLSGCTLQQLQDTLDSLPSDSLVVLRLCRVGGFNSSNLTGEVKSSNNRQSAAPTGPTPPGPGQQPDGPGRSPGGASSADSSSGAGRSPNSNKDGGSTSSERGGHVRSVDSAICTDAQPVVKTRDHPRDPIALSELISSAVSMSRQSCYDNLKLDPASGDWVPSSSLTSLTQASQNRQLLAALESAIWEMDVTKLKDTTCQGIGNKNGGLLLAPSTKSATLPPPARTQNEAQMTRSQMATATPVSTTATSFISSSVRTSKSFATTSELLPTSKPPVQPPHILTATVTSKPIYLAAEHFMVNDRPLSGCFQMASATQTEEPPQPQHAIATVQHHSPALASVTSSSLLVSEDTFEMKQENGERTSKYIDESPSPQVCCQNGVNEVQSPTPNDDFPSQSKMAPLSKPECVDSPLKNFLPPPPHDSPPLPQRPLKKSASARSFRSVGDAILRRLFDRSSTSSKIKQDSSAEVNSKKSLFKNGNKPKAISVSD